MAKCVPSELQKYPMHVKSAAHHLTWSKAVEIKWCVWDSASPCWMFFIISPNCLFSSWQRIESVMLMFMPTAITCEVSAMQSAPYGIKCHSLLMQVPETHLYRKWLFSLEAVPVQLCWQSWSCLFWEAFASRVASVDSMELPSWLLRSKIDGCGTGKNERTGWKNNFHEH